MHGTIGDLAPWLLVAASIAYLAFEAATFSRLKRFHAQVWEELGRPTLLATSQPQIRRAFSSWVRKRGDKPLGDSVLSTLVTSGRVIFVSFFLILVAVVIIWITG